MKNAKPGQAAYAVAKATIIIDAALELLDFQLEYDEVIQMRTILYRAREAKASFELGI